VSPEPTAPATAPPAHVPPGLVDAFELEFRGPMAQLFSRMDAIRGDRRAVWLADGLDIQADPDDQGAHRGAWFFTQAEDIRAALANPTVFSSQLGGPDGLPMMIPIFMDPPDHTRYRRLLNPLFSPGVVATMEDDVRQRIRHLIEEVADRGSCDFVVDIALRFPTGVFTSWIGLPEDQTQPFVALVAALMHSGDAGARDLAMLNAFGALNELIANRVADPGNDLMSQIARLEIDGRPLDTEELLKIAFLLLLAGLDTVVAALSFSFWHLAQTPADRRAIATGAVPVATAVEELLRRHSFVNLPRVVAVDAEFAGVSLRRGDPVVLSLAMASRDPAEFDDATGVHLDRDANRHFAFGMGPHRCLGSHLARLEMRVALEEWHKRIPDYRLDGDVGAYAGTGMGVTTLPLAWP
jgi:cytochrome P450